MVSWDPTAPGGTEDHALQHHTYILIKASNLLYAAALANDASPDRDSELSGKDEGEAFDNISEDKIGTV